MNFGLTLKKNQTIPLIIWNKTFSAYQKQLTDFQKQWLKSIGFTGKPGSFALMPHETGDLAIVLYIYDEKDDYWQIAQLVDQLPTGTYAIENISDWDDFQLLHFHYAWAMAHYSYGIHKQPKEQKKPSLYLQDQVTYDHLAIMIEAVYKVRDLINTPANLMTPAKLEEELLQLSKKHKAKAYTIKGKELLKQNFPLIHAVGRAGEHEPRLLVLEWGQKTDPLVSLVGKGVCFDTGGLDLKPANAMRLMKKDMGGAAHVIGLAKLIMGKKLPIRLQVLIPAVENNVSANAMRPGDVYPSRAGQTVEIGHTDAEGRLVLADALTYATEHHPNLIIDIATLTGAARVAVGAEIAPFFTNDNKIAQSLMKIAKRLHDPLWELPLHKPYRSMLKSSVADLDNDAGGTGYGGAILAALFLEQFVQTDSDKICPWVHFDIMAWNRRARPGRPIGGEAMALGPLYLYLKETFAS